MFTTPVASKSEVVRAGSRWGACMGVPGSGCCTTGKLQHQTCSLVFFQYIICALFQVKLNNYGHLKSIKPCSKQIKVVWPENRCGVCVGVSQSRCDKMQSLFFYLALIYAIKRLLYYWRCSFSGLELFVSYRPQHKSWSWSLSDMPFCVYFKYNLKTVATWWLPFRS